MTCEPRTPLTLLGATRAKPTISPATSLDGDDGDARSAHAIYANKVDTDEDEAQGLRRLGKQGTISTAHKSECARCAHRQQPSAVLGVTQQRLQSHLVLRIRYEVLCIGCAFG